MDATNAAWHILAAKYTTTAPTHCTMSCGSIAMTQRRKSDRDTPPLIFCAKSRKDYRSGARIGTQKNCMQTDQKKGKVASTWMRFLDERRVPALLWITPACIGSTFFRYDSISICRAYGFPINLHVPIPQLNGIPPAIFFFCCAPATLLLRELSGPHVANSWKPRKGLVTNAPSRLQKPHTALSIAKAKVVRSVAWMDVTMSQTYLNMIDDQANSTHITNWDDNLKFSHWAFDQLAGWGRPGNDRHEVLSQHPYISCVSIHLHEWFSKVKKEDKNWEGTCCESGKPEVTQIIWRRFTDERKYGFTMESHQALLLHLPELKALGTVA